MIYDLPLIQKLIDNYNGDYSSLFPLMKDRIIPHLKTTNTPEHYEGFLGNFMFFEHDYFQIRKDMILSGIEEEVYDIGAQMGFQSDLFLENGYVGIESYRDNLFNNGHPKVRYILETFPSPSIDLTDKVVVSNMSISFFQNYIDKDKSKEEVDDITLDEMEKAKTLYFRGTPSYTEKLKKRFKYCARLDSYEDIEVLVVIKPDKLPSNLKIRRPEPVTNGLWKFWN